MTAEPATPKKPRRRWWQYSLRTVFVLLTVACVWSGWTVHRANEQRKVVEWVREMGGTVYYDYQYDEDDTFLDDAEPPGPKWLRDSLGAAYFQEVSSVGFYYTQVSDVTPLAGLTSLKWLKISGAPVSEEQVEELRRALPNCDIYWSPPDPSP